MSGWSSNGLSAAGLSDGRIQLWASQTGGRIWSSWESGNDYVYWQSPWTAAMPPFQSDQMTAAPLSDKRLQFWAVDTAGKIWSCWKTTTDSNSAWSPWTSSWTVQAPPFLAKQVAAAPLSDGRLQFWAVDTSGRIWSCWKTTTNPNSNWSSWALQWTAQLPPFSANYVTAAQLSDGRLQFWAVDTTGKTWSCWKSTTDPNASWTAWVSQWTTQAQPFIAKTVVAARLSDKRLQFWAVDTNGHIWSIWKTDTGSSAAWTNWTQGWTADVPTFVTRTIWAAPLSDGRLRVWVIDTDGEIRTTAKTTSDSNAAWTNWSLVFFMVSQQQTNWCWSGCSVATSHFYKPDSGFTQCSLASSQLSLACCNSPLPSGCNVPWFLDKALTGVGNFDHFTSVAETDATITAQIKSGQPLGVRVAWSGGGAHFIMAVGGGPNDMVQIRDPIYGDSYIPYNTLKTSYQGSGSWTHSYFTKK
jgi:hypothetical protein